VGDAGFALEEEQRKRDHRDEGKREGDAAQLLAHALRGEDWRHRSPLSAQS
jgi:hypothetical protein